MSEKANSAFEEVLMQIADEVDRRGGTRQLKAKQYSIYCLREEGFSNTEIEELLNIKL